MMISGPNLLHIGHMSQLRWLSLVGVRPTGIKSYQPITGSEIAGLPNLTKLSSIQLWVVDDITPVVLALRSSTNLRLLSFKTNKIDPDTANALHQLKGLATLEVHLYDGGIHTNFDWRLLPKSAGLRRLSLDYHDLSTNDLKELRRFRDLEELVFSRTNKRPWLESEVEKIRQQVQGCKFPHLDVSKHLNFVLGDLSDTSTNNWFDPATVDPFKI